MDNQQLVLAGRSSFGHLYIRQTDEAKKTKRQAFYRRQDSSLSRQSKKNDRAQKISSAIIEFLQDRVSKTWARINGADQLPCAAPTP